MPVLTPCGDADKKQILGIINHAIMHTTALYDYEPRSIETMEAWFETKRRGASALIG